MSLVPHSGQNLYRIHSVPFVYSEHTTGRSERGARISSGLCPLSSPYVLSSLENSRNHRHCIASTCSQHGGTIGKGGHSKICGLSYPGRLRRSAQCAEYARHLRSCVRRQHARCSSDGGAACLRKSERTRVHPSCAVILSSAPTAGKESEATVCRWRPRCLVLRGLTISVA